MPKPVGGRGKKAPYESTFVRVPIPVKKHVEQLVAFYRNQVLSGGEADYIPIDADEFSIALRLVNRFIEEKGQSEKLSQRNNVNLVRFRDWLYQNIEQNS